MRRRPASERAEKGRGNSDFRLRLRGGPGEAGVGVGKAVLLAWQCTVWKLADAGGHNRHRQRLLRDRRSRSAVPDRAGRKLQRRHGRPTTHGAVGPNPAWLPRSPSKRCQQGWTEWGRVQAAAALTSCDFWQGGQEGSSVEPWMREAAWDWIEDSMLSSAWKEGESTLPRRCGPADPASMWRSTARGQSQHKHNRRQYCLLSV